MLPEEVARYDEHWLDVAEKISNEALDNQIDFIKNGGITKPGGGAYKPAKISAAVDLNTGDYILDITVLISLILQFKKYIQIYNKE